MLKRIVVLAVLGGVAMVACDLGKTTSQASARKVMVGTLLSTPDIPVKAAAVAGFDASSPFLDAGINFADAGFTVPGQTIAVTFFGTRVGDGVSQAPEGIGGADVTLAQKSGSSWKLKEQSGGTYQLTSLEDAGLKYQDNADYTFSAAAEGETFVGKVDKVPERENIAQLHNSQGYLELAANSPFSFTRPDPPTGQERNLGFVNVFPVSTDGKQGAEPTYTNIPMSAIDFLKLIIAPSDWKQTTVTIPATAFPDANKNYLIVFLTAKTGGPDSENLFIGSAIIAGTADVAIVKTH